MRLICPNCGAQYEVDPSVIPESGRDVQCSSCGHTWFQASQSAMIAAQASDPVKSAAWPEHDLHETEEPAPASQDADFEAEEPAEPEATAFRDRPPEVHAHETDEMPPVSSEPAEEPSPVADLTEVDDGAPPSESPPLPPAEVPVAPSPEAPVEPPQEWPDEPPAEVEPELPEEIPQDWPEDLAEDMAAAGETLAATQSEAEPAPALRRKTLDDAVMAILREEAEREARARVSEGVSVETQGDLGLTTAAAGAAVAAGGERAARLRDLDGDTEIDAENSHGTHRRGVLPDIEEINSTLRATSDRGDEAAARDAPETLRRKRSGFRFGFSSAFLIALFLLGIYLLAPSLAGRVPALDPALEGYVGTVDRGRLWLDSVLKSSTEAMRPGASPEAGGN